MVFTFTFHTNRNRVGFFLATLCLHFPAVLLDPHLNVFNWRFTAKQFLFLVDMHANLYGMNNELGICLMLYYKWIEIVGNLEALEANFYIDAKRRASVVSCFFFVLSFLLSF